MSDATTDVAGFERYLSTATDKGKVTRGRYAYEVKRFFQFVEGRSLNEVRASDLLQFNAMLHDGGAARGTVGLKLAALGAFLSYME